MRFVVLCALLELEKDKNEEDRRSKVIRSRHYITSQSLLKDPRDSPWYTLYHVRNRGSFINTVSLDPDSFEITGERQSSCGTS